VFTTAPEFLSPAVPKGAEEVRIELPRAKTMVNVGSVGQPRDGDPRACYVVQEDDAAVRFRRIAYPCDVTCAKIRGIPDLDNYLGDRLLQGR
jgi:diadenosine tetraphosphatase ApaH/serine/threonine PP2A family protein phosphatase